jgi:hypothetical protein
VIFSCLCLTHWLVSDVVYSFPSLVVFSKKLSIRRSGGLLARFEEAVKEEEVPQDRGCAAAT